MEKEKGGYVYILSSKGKRLYVGVTSQLRIRVSQHKTKTDPKSFTARYNVDRLVYYQGFSRIEEAIARETRIKNMHRIQKIALIVGLNPTWEDLSEHWGKPMPAFDESKMRASVRFERKACPTEV